VHGGELQKFEPGWRLAIGTVLGSMGAAVGSVGGVGGGGFFIPMLTLVIGFDTKTTTALSKCEDLWKCKDFSSSGASQLQCLSHV